MKSISIILFALTLVGCHAAPESIPAKTAVEPENLEASDSHSAPVDLVIDDDANDGERLHVKGSVKAATEWPKENVIVHLVAVKGDEKIGESYYPLLQPGEDPNLEAGETEPFSISVSASDATDYRIELLWGEDAVAFRNTNTPKDSPATELAAVSESSSAPSTNEIVLRSIRSEFKGEPCVKKEECPGAFVVRGVLHNDGLNKADLVTLAIGLLDKASREPLSEEQVRVEALNLPGGGVREIKFDIAVPGGLSPFALEPFVRIVDFGSK